MHANDMGQNVKHNVSSSNTSKWLELALFLYTARIIAT